MQQRIVVKVAMKTAKERSKAMKIAVGVLGVISVMVGGEDKDVVIAIGNEVDAVTLTRLLIKKFGNATLVRVEPLNCSMYDNNYTRSDQVDQSQVAATMIYEGYPSYNYTHGNNNYNQQPMSCYNYPLQYYPHQQYYYAYERPGDSSCSIM